MKREDVIESSGNVFADLGLENADELHAKGVLALAIIEIIEDRGLTPYQAADLLGTDRSHISRLKNGRIEGFKFDRLLRFLNKLDKDVELRVKEKPQDHETGSVHVAI